jgi:hypothetical protein
MNGTSWISGDQQGADLLWNALSLLGKSAGKKP